MLNKTFILLYFEVRDYRTADLLYVLIVLQCLIIGIYIVLCGFLLMGSHGMHAYLSGWATGHCNARLVQSFPLQ